MKHKKIILPLLGSTAIVTCAAPIIASCGCSITNHVWYSPRLERKRVANDDYKAIFILILDSDKYSESDLHISVLGKNRQSLAIDSIKINGTTVEVCIKCVDTTLDGEIPFELEVKTNEWTGLVENLALVVNSSIESIEINGASTIEVDMPSNYKAVCKDKSGKEIEHNVTWSLESGTGGTISPSGMTCTVTGDTIGETLVLKAASVKDPTIYATKDIYVDYASATVTITGDPSIHEGEIKDYSATIEPQAKTEQRVTWSVEPSGAAEITESTDTTCKVKGVTSGSNVTLVATPVKGSPATKPIKILGPYAESVEITDYPSEIWNDEMYTCKATVSAASGTPEQDVEWKVSDETKASIGTSGLFTPADGSYGNVKITATAKDTLLDPKPSDTKTVSIKMPATGLLITGDSTITLPKTGTIDKTYTIDKLIPEKAYSSGVLYDWKSSNTEVATIKGDATTGIGTLTAKAVGTTKITAKIQSRDEITSEEFTVTVLPPVVEGITVTGSTNIWEDDETKNLKYGYETDPKGTEVDIEWSVYAKATGTDVPEGVTITKDGDYGVLSIDQTKVTKNISVYIEAKDTKTSVTSPRYEVKIKALLDEFEISGDSTARVDETQPVYSYSASADQTYDASTISFASENKSVATISTDTSTGKGTLNSIDSGTTKISATIKTHNKTIKSKNTITVTVNKPYAKTVTIDGEKNLWFDADEDARVYSATITPEGAAKDLDWEVDSLSTTIISHLATVEGNKVRAVLTQAVEGEAIIHATAKDKETGAATGSYKINVMRPATKLVWTTAPEEVTVKTGATYVAEPRDDNDVVCTHGVLQYSIADEDAKYAEINANTGILTAKAVKPDSGKVTVKASYVQQGRADVVATTQVSIKAAYVDKIDIEGPTVITSGQIASYKAILQSGQEDTINWTITNAAPAGCATIDGSATGLTISVATSAAGEFDLTAAAQNGTGTKTIHVKIVPISWDQIFKIENKQVVDFVDNLQLSTLQNYVGYNASTSATNNTLIFPNDDNVTGIASSFAGKVSTGSLSAQSGVTKLDIPSNITVIEDNALSNNAIVQEVTIAGKTSIGASAFVGNSALKTLNAVQVTSIGVSAFEADSALETIDLGNTVNNQAIGNRAFAEIANTNTVTLKANPYSIGTEAFQHSTNLVWSDINSASFINSIKEAAFEATQLLPTGETLKVTDALTKATIQPTAFYDCKLESIELIPQVSDTMYQNWSDGIFANCLSLSKIDISSWTTGIPANLAEKVQLFYYANGEATGGIWYYPAAQGDSPSEEFLNWMTKEIAEETIGNWTPTKK